MALTGYTRDGSCIEQSDDTGSHHICINLNSTSGGNFCEVTGQEDWCSATDMPCHEDSSSDTTCAIQNWCVCQWAFASYIEKAGGCDEIQEIRCEAINWQALRAYQTTSGYETALACLVARCGIDDPTNATSTSSTGLFLSVLFVLVAALIWMGSTIAMVTRVTTRRRQKPSPHVVGSTKSMALLEDAKEVIQRGIFS